MKKFCEFLREHVMKIIDFKLKKTPKLLTNKHQESYDNTKIGCTCNKKFEEKYIRDKIYCILALYR